MVLLVALLTIGPMIVLSQIAAHLRLDVVDDQMFGYFGWRIAHGATVYVDVWDNKPPGIYWINAVGFLLGGGASYGGVIALCATALVTAHVLFYLICASLFTRGAAALTTILASFFLTHIYYQGGTNRTETFLIVFELAAVLLYMRAFLADRWWKWLLVGGLCGCAFLFKQVGLAAWGAMGLHTIALVLMRELDWRAGLRRCLLLLAGMVGVVLAAVAVLAAQGALDGAWYAVIGFNRAYFAAGDSSFWETYANYHLLSMHAFPILRLPVLMAIAALIHASVWWFRPDYRPQEIEAPLRAIRPVCPHYILLLTIWCLVAFYGATVSPGHYRHYLIPSIAPLMLLGGYLMNVIKTELGLLRRLAQRGWVVGVFVAMGWFALPAVRLQIEQASRVWLDRFERGDGITLAPWEKIGDLIAKHSTPDEKIQVWNYVPGAYLRARRVNACRFITTEKVGQVGKFAQPIADEIQRTLTEHPPPVFAIHEGDYEWTRNPNDQQTLDDFGKWLGRWLDQYEIVDEVVEENTLILRRRDLLSSDPARAGRPSGRGSRSEPRPSGSGSRVGDVLRETAS